tara:strand:+ start:489 stop:2894 length:2406 start_codon:yes stop_codon:yes gene_type:complete
MANQGFVKTLNLDEISDGSQTIQNLAGGTVDADLRVFAGLSKERSQLFWNRFKNSTEINQSVASLKNGTQFMWDTNYTYTDDDAIYIEPINILRDFVASYIGFDEGGVEILNPLGANDFNFDIGEGYPEGHYLVSLSGGTGSGAEAEIKINSNGNVYSVKITANGTNFSQGDKLVYSGVLAAYQSVNEYANIFNQGVGFVIRITALPWTATAVGNFAWDVDAIDTKDLRVTFDNCNTNLDGTYTIDKSGGRNVWGVPNNASTLPYDINRQITVQEKINNNLEIYDIDGDGSITASDKTYLEMYINGDNEATFTTYIQNNPVPAGSTRQTGPAIYRYIAGLAPSVLDVDGTGVDNAVDVSLFNSYVTGGGVVYERRTAIQSATGLQNSGALNHAISVTCKIPRNPGDVTSQIGDIYNTPYFFIEKEQTGDWVNIYNNFDKYGTQQTCTTSEADYINTSIGVLKTDFSGLIDTEYRIIDKYVISGVYYVKIVASGFGFMPGMNFGTNPTLNASIGVPVFNKSSEYGVFDSDGSSKFYLRTNPRSGIDSIKDMVLFATSYYLYPAESSQYANTAVPTLTLLPDLVFKRDDSLTLSNIQNLEVPEISDDGDNQYSTAGGFSYGITDGYAGELANITDNVDESIYLRGTKYRIDRNLYYQKEIRINGFVTSYDPDELNISQTDLLTDLSPGIYISSSLSQITNPLASDYANKTRSFSSDFNPWSAVPTNSELYTQSLNVTINDLVWTTEIGLDIGTVATQNPPLPPRFNFTGNETFSANFDTTDNTAYKLKILINGEVFYWIMKKS